jgi:hypothetical protein
MITPEIFLQSIKSYQTGDRNFCKIASVPAKCDGIPINNNIGFWFEVIENDPNLVLSVQYDAMTTDEPVKIVTISGEDGINSFFDQAREWAINVLKCHE